MSTRANIIIKDSEDALIFYRHSDGYPKGVKNTLTRFLDFVKQQKIRDNTQQSAGWLILLGHLEYLEGGLCAALPGEHKYLSWKVGAYEPTTCIHGDIEYLYEIDLCKLTLRGWEYACGTKLQEVFFPET